jgi:hypothetical protein
MITDMTQVNPTVKIGQTSSLIGSFRALEDTELMSIDGGCWVLWGEGVCGTGCYGAVLSYCMAGLNPC